MKSRSSFALNVSRLLAVGTASAFLLGSIGTLTGCSVPSYGSPLGATKTTSKAKKKTTSTATDDSAEDEETDGDDTEGTPAGTTPTGSSTGSGAGTGAGNGTGSGNGAGNGTGSGSGSFDVMLAQSTATMELKAKTELMVTIAPKGYAGSVALTATGLPTGVTVAFEPATVNVTGTAGASAKVIVTTASSVAPGALKLSIAAAGGGASKTADVNVTVQPQITLRIPANAQNGDKNMFGEYPIRIASGVNVKIVNDDSTPHIIHGNGGGFGHGDTGNPLQQGETDPVTRRLTNKTTYSFYLHDQQQAPTGQIVVQ